MNQLHRNRRAVGGAALLLLLLLPACGSVQNTTGPESSQVIVGESAIRTELYFGLTRRSGTTISETEWKGFLDTVITPRFRDGLTVIDAKGQWEEGSVIVQEATKVLILIHEGTAATSAAIEEIRDIYTRDFDQTSVMRVDEAVNVSF